MKDIDELGNSAMEYLLEGPYNAGSDVLNSHVQEAAGEELNHSPQVRSSLPGDMEDVDESGMSVMRYLI
jgi:hypothetical protein